MRGLQGRGERGVVHLLDEGLERELDDVRHHARDGRLMGRQAAGRDGGGEPGQE